MHPESNADQEPLLYRNTTPAAGHWLGLALTGTASNRDAIGARVMVRTPTRSVVRHVDGGNGYAGQSTLGVHVGLGTETRVERIEIRWPSGRRQVVERPTLDRITKVVEDGPSPARRPAGNDGPRADSLR